MGAASVISSFASLTSMDMADATCKWVGGWVGGWVEEVTNVLFYA